MPNRRAHVRLLTCAILLALGWLLACRPAWSPDGKRLLHPFPLGPQRLGLACHDRDHGTSEILFTPDSTHALVGGAWLADGRTPVVVWSSGEPPNVELHVKVWREGSPTLTLPLPRVQSEEAFAALRTHPVLAGDQLLLAADGIVRCDLATGTIEQRAEPGREQSAIARRGEDVCYLRSPDHTWQRWEIGGLDPRTLERTVWFTAPADSPWQVLPMPAFSPDLRRLVLPARRAGTAKEAALLVFADGVLENTVSLGADATIGNAEWLPDGVTLVATVMRQGVGQPTRWSLFESTVSGSVQRETPLVAEHPSRDDSPFAVHGLLSVSPDGRTVAVSTAAMRNLDADQHGLLLVDLGAPARTVTRVPFPAASELRLSGTDDVLSGLQALPAAYATAVPGTRVSLSSGRTATGLFRLLRDECDVAVGPQVAAPQLATAAQQGQPLAEHALGREALVVCVHPDNPVGSLTMEQLEQLVRSPTPLTWHLLGVALPDKGTVAKTHAVRGKDGHTVLFRGLRGDLALALPVTRHGAAADVLAAVRSDVGAIGVLRRGEVDTTVRTIPIRAPGANEPARADDAAIADGSYPVTRPLFVYARQTSKPEVAAFLEWLTTPAGQQVLRAAGIVPVP